MKQCERGRFCGFKMSGMNRTRLGRGVRPNQERYYCSVCKTVVIVKLVIVAKGNRENEEDTGS